MQHSIFANSLLGGSSAVQLLRRDLSMIPIPPVSKQASTLLMRVRAIGVFPLDASHLRHRGAGLCR